MPNRLAAEQSPYLQQHANNPVDWYPWGDEALAKARADDKPIFLSIGYSTCHWCHVMEHESFEAAGIAEILNRDFVAIKVDREERPDVDRVYMTFVQATTGSGGWPMSVWLTPSLHPFFGGTYFPPAAQFGRPGFADILAEISRAWQNDRANILKSSAQIVERLVAIAGGQARARTPEVAALAATRQQFEQSFDTTRGGFGDAPKFPRPSELLFLLREHARTGDAGPRDMVLQTLRAMALGGMRDHIGGGFHRYSVDGGWRVPHFEKMLYDQAQLVLAFLEGAQAGRDPFMAQIAEDTLQYVAREMTDEAGGFHSAEDADSVPPDQAGDVTARKTEGAFYLWSLDELQRVLGTGSVAFALRYGVRQSGNAPFDPHHEFTGRNILYSDRSISDIARETLSEPAAVADVLLRARQALFEVREQRPRPYRDDKVLTAWNGLTIAAFARAARVLDAADESDLPPGHEEPGLRHLAAAERAAVFLKQTMWNDDTRTLLRRYRAGDAGIAGYAEDYACLVFGLLELFQSSGKTEWLSWAIDLQARQDELFADAVGGGWFSTTGADATVLLRMKEDYDGAEPSPTSVSALNLLTLAHLTGDTRYSTRAADAIASFGERLVEMGRAVPLMAAALETAIDGGQQIVVLGVPGAADTRAMWRAVNRPYRPFAVVVPIAPGAAQVALAKLMPWVADMLMIDGRATAYVCRDRACERPTTDIEALA